jgi:hypothetical protein
MKTLASIKKALVVLRDDTLEPDEGTFEEAASLLRLANDLAVVEGVAIKPVGSMCSPADALAIVSKYIAGVPTETTHLTATALAKVLGCRPSTIKAYLRGLVGNMPKYFTQTEALWRLGYVWTKLCSANRFGCARSLGCPCRSD